MDFFFSFLGSFIGCLIFLYFIYPKQVTGHYQQEKQEQKTKTTAKSKPQGTILKAPDPEDERRRKSIEFERKVYERV